MASDDHHRHHEGVRLHPSKGDAKLIQQTLSNAYTAISLLKNLKSAAFANSQLEYELAKWLATKDIYSLSGGSNNAEIDFILGLIATNTPGAILEFLSYLEKKFNSDKETFYNRFCGASISIVEPTVIGSQIRFGYSVKNTSRIPIDNEGLNSVKRKCFISVKKQWNGTIKPNNNSIATGEKYGVTDVITNYDFESNYFYIPFEKGYTYYFIARIELCAEYTAYDVDSKTGYIIERNVMRNITYSSDVCSISADNIGEIKTNGIKYENNQVHFDFIIYGDKLWGHNMGVELFHDGKKVWENYDNIGTGSRCVLKLNRDQFDCNYNIFKATAKGKWQLRSYVLMDMTNELCYSQFVDFEKLVYEKYPSVIFFNPIIQKTEEISTRTRSDDDDDSKKYITFFSYGLDVKGGFWIEQYDAKSDTEGTIGVLSRTYPQSDGQEAFDYSWTYSEKNPISPTLWYDIKLRNGKNMKSVNELKFKGCPMTKIEYDNLFISNQ